MLCFQGFEVYCEGFGCQQPSPKLTIKLRANPHKIHDKQPSLIGNVALSKHHLTELTSILTGKEFVFLRVALWDDTDRGGEQEYPINGVIEYCEIPLTPTTPTTHANTGEWF